MTGTVDIGAARVRLIVDANEFDAPIREGQNAVKAFGAVAEAAYDKQQKATRRAANALLDYVSQLQRMGTGAANFKSLDTAAAKMDELVRKASRMGVVDDVLKPAIGAWQKYAQAVMQAEAVQEDQQRGAATAIAAAKQAQLQAQITLYNRVEQAARDAAQAEAAQAAINVRTGVGSSTGLAARDQSALIAELQRQVQLEQQIEAEARDINREVNRWKSQLDAIGKDYYDIQIAQARLRYGAGADPIVKQIEALRQANTTIRGTTVNAKQLQQAIRFLPAQFTDIGVSLASGMNPALVLFQQGGQIFDQFRLAGVGAGGALKEIGVRAMALVNPWTLAAAAVAAFAIAANSAENDVSRLNTALAQTGNYVNQSVGQLQAYIAELNAIPDVTAGTARSAVEAVVGSGRFNGEQFQAVAQAAARMEAEVGQSIDATIRKFEDIAKNPVDALMRLNDAEHFLTQAQIDRIYQLQEEGKQQEAATLAVKLYADSLNHVADVASSATPHLTQMWHDIKDAISEVWEYTKGYADFLAGVIGKMAKERSLWNLVPIVGFYRAASNLEPPVPVAPEAPPAPVQDPKEAERQRRATEDLLAQGDKVAEQALAFQRHERDLRRELDAGRITVDQYTAALSRFGEAQRKANERSSRAHGHRRDGPDPTRSIKAWQQAELEALNGVQRATKWAYEDNAMTVEAYYAKLDEFAKQERDIAVESAQRQIAALAGRQDAAERIEALQENIRQADTAYANKKAENDRAEVLAIRDRERALQGYIKALDDANKQTQRDADLEVARIGMGSVRYQRMVAINDALRKRQELEDEIARKEANFELSAAEAERYREALGRINDQITIMVDGFSRLDEAQANWQNGAQRAWENWLDQVRNTADKAEQFFNQAFDGLAESITDLLTGSGNSFKEYFDNLARMITKFIVEQKLTEWLGSLKAGGGGGGGWLDFAGNFLGALLGGGGGGGGKVGGLTKNAQGGVYASAGLSAYRNQIVSQPTVFPFARGGVPNVGIMGETYRPEAIVPLARMPGGDLGVKMDTRGGQRGPITVQQTFVVNGTPDRMTRGQMLRAAGSETSRAIRRG